MGSLDQFSPRSISEHCQTPALLGASRYFPRTLTRIRMIAWHMQKQGLRKTILEILRHTGAFAAWIPLTKLESNQSARTAVNEILNLQPKEWVEVRSKTEILATLDAEGKHKGLRFVPEMFEYCGRRVQVFKRVNKICLEESPDVRRIRNTVLLEGSLCKGGGVGCDRACFHFWREAWLRRIPIQ
jgi:hypothetical protein